MRKGVERVKDERQKEREENEGRGMNAVHCEILHKSLI